MSDTEVTVTRSAGGGWWRMEYKGQMDFLEYEPSADDKREFRATVDRNTRQRSAEQRLRMNGHERTVEEKAWNR